MKSVGDKFPKFKKQAVLADNQFGTVTSEDHKKAGKWMVIYFYPKDFTFVCPTEIVEFNNSHAKFEELNAELYGVSTDTAEVHLAWKSNDPRLANLSYPLIEDTSKSLCKKLGILQPGSVAYRATFIVDPEGKIQWVNCNNDATGRNVAEVLRALEATQNPGLTGCNWQPGDNTL
ncbi:peroxiredoxin [uncultured Draconibacterium sp.]|uniref:peroxiredoxin n=1 Tax=uncultured Draconibacterium sp. TaxID=1573823 RepID=UPI002AA7054E|nr:peroxiredoxin [uncultured Draconibacterium sp.]